MPLKQANRLLVLKTPLGEDVLELTAFSGCRGDLPAVQLSPGDDLQQQRHRSGPDRGQARQLRHNLPQRHARWFHGIVRRFFAAR